MPPPWIWHRGEPIEPLRELLRRGGVVAVPTESSYGLAVDPLNSDAVETVYRIKGREASKPLLVVVCDRAQAERLGADLSDPTLQPLTELWPAALTLLVPLRQAIPAAQGSDRIALRVPDNELLRQLLRRLDMPLTATSANRSGRPAICSPDELLDLLSGYDAAIIDGGRLPGGPPSTLVALEKGRLQILRQGRVDLSKPSAGVEAMETK